MKTNILYQIISKVLKTTHGIDKYRISSMELNDNLEVNPDGELETVKHINVTVLPEQQINSIEVTINLDKDGIR
ncbi:hypothetical protein KY321_04810 [Candidatus Woesearchaeota archaeon]|nr:hypothetical protein [Candidatus Woesearchaeota archaeon]